MNTDGFINVAMRLQAVVCAWKEHVTNIATREEFQWLENTEMLILYTTISDTIN